MLGHTSGARSYAPIASRFLGANNRIHVMSVPVFVVSVLRLINNLQGVGSEATCSKYNIAPYMTDHRYLVGLGF